MTISMNRRTLAKVGTLGALSAFFGTTVQAQVKKTQSPNWDEETDIIVVGSGFAGLAAAYEAKKRNADVIVLEKMPTAGGNSIINGGIMAVPGTEIQKSKGIKDSPELMMKDTIKAGLGLNHPDKVKAMCEEAYPAYRMLVDELGVKFSDKILKHEGGHSVPRSMYTINGRGSEIVTKQLAALEKLGVKPRIRTIVDKIFVDPEGRVIGVAVRQNYRFGKENSGKPKNIKARKAVILANGGFSADVAYRSMFDPKLGEAFQTTNQPGATAELWREAADLGAQLIQQDWIQCLPYTSPDEPGFGIGWAWAGHTQAYGFWIDAATGKRFVNELADRKIRCDAILSHLNEGHDCLSVGDKKTMELFNVIRPGWSERQKKIKVLFEYPTLEDMAKAYNIPLEALQETIAVVNDSIKTKKDPMGRRVNEDLKPQDEGPWFVTRLSPKVHHCMGGLLTNPQAQVLDNHGKVIPGLYAAGESTGDVHGAVRLGSNAVTDCIVNGRIAGRNAAS